ncbi:hypothetical protein [Streptomyces sp. TRM68416]|uniref:hypothetical protein n=1 Tax=Streptomyces sp. TRM68416 TaxID=2758412 RepID=UPI001CB6EC4E|nr:hypothetical protein [Streptomyces sp. TRM68416]
MLHKGPTPLALLPASVPSHQQAETVRLGEASCFHGQGDVPGVRSAGQLNAHASGCRRRLADYVGQQLVQSGEWFNAGTQRTWLKYVFGGVGVVDAESRRGERGRCPFGEAVDALEERLGRVAVLPRQRAGDDTRHQTVGPQMRSQQCQVPRSVQFAGLLCQIERGCTEDTRRQSGLSGLHGEFDEVGLVPLALLHADPYARRLVVVDFHDESGHVRRLEPALAVDPTGAL